MFKMLKARRELKRFNFEEDILRIINTDGEMSVSALARLLGKKEPVVLDTCTRLWSQERLKMRQAEVPGKEGFRHFLYSIPKQTGRHRAQEEETDT